MCMAVKKEGGKAHIQGRGTREHLALHMFRRAMPPARGYLHLNGRHAPGSGDATTA